jgi:hypothetical protein
MKKGDLVKILSVFSKADEKYIGTVGVLRYRPMGLDNTWGVFVGNRTLYLADERLELL